MVIYRAEDLPRTDLGVIAAVRKALPGAGPSALIDAYVKVAFGGNIVSTLVDVAEIKSVKIQVHIRFWFM